MPVIPPQTLELTKRYWNDYGSNSAKYGFFAFLIVVFVLFIGGTCLLNRRRIQTGGAPIISRYLAPPTYYQAQRDQNVDTQLPTYTAEVNPNQDIGYYDQTGTFVPYTKQELNTPGSSMPGQYPNNGAPSPPAPNPFDINATGSTAVTPTADANVQQPINAYHRDDFDADYPNFMTNSGTTYTPPGPPPTQTQTQTQNTDSSELPTYTAPSGPPPSHNRS